MPPPQESIFTTSHLPYACTCLLVCWVVSTWRSLKPELQRMVRTACTTGLPLHHTPHSSINFQELQIFTGAIRLACFPFQAYNRRTHLCVGEFRWQYDQLKLKSLISYVLFLSSSVICEREVKTHTMPLSLAHFFNHLVQNNLIGLKTPVNFCVSLSENILSKLLN